MMSLARHALVLALLLPAAASAAWAQASKERAVGFGNFGSSKEPIKIDANKLDVFDKEGRAVFTGDVVAVQGESTMKCTIMTVFYEQRDQNGGQATPAAQGADDSAIKKIDCKGPVTIVSRTQTATGDNAVFDRTANRILLTGNVAALALGALLIGLSSYLPTWAQSVLGASALEAGFALAALTLGWPIAASQAGRLYLRIGFRNTALIGVVLAVLGTTGTALLGLHAQLWQVAASMFVTGIGLGLSSSPLIVAVQSVVGWDRRGVVTATNMFARSIGSAVGAAVFGAIANTTLAGRFASPPAGLEGDVPTDVDGTTAALSQGGAVAEYARESLHAASHGVFIATAVTAVVIAVAVAAMPRRTERLRFDDEQSTDEAAAPGPGPAAETAGHPPEPGSADGHRPFAS